MMNIEEPGPEANSTAYDRPYGEGLDQREKPGEILRKDKLDIVTSADLQAEELILNSIKLAFPDHDVLTEETTHARTKSPYLWIIDPLDGTVNYASGLPLFCVSIAVQYEGKTLAGVVHLPAMHETYAASRGGGAHRGTTRLAVSQSEISEAIVAVILTSHFSEEHSHGTLSIITGLSGHVRGVRIIVSEALELAYIASGRLDGNVCIKADPYGAAAGQLLIEEAGGRVTDFAGMPFGTKSRSIIASNGRIHQELLNLVASRQLS